MFTTRPPPFDAGPTRKFLEEHEFPAGLIDTVLATKDKFAHRYWIVDNSGSMTILDGHRFVASKGKERIVSCSRYEEARDVMLFHGELASLLHAPTTFNFINHPNVAHQGPHSFTVSSPDTLQPFLAAVAAHAREGDPICQRVREVTAAIAKDEEKLRSEGKECVVVIVTDGMPTDGDLWEAMEPLTKLPVKIVVRLCCEEQKVLKFWQDLDEKHHIDLDVLDDLHGEAAEVHRVNPWFTYATQVHRVREWGVHLKALDLLDERKLNGAEVDELLVALFGDKANGLPNPQEDMPAFKTAMEELQKTAHMPHNLLHTGYTPYVDCDALDKHFKHINEPPPEHTERGSCVIS